MLKFKKFQNNIKADQLKVHSRNFAGIDISGSYGQCSSDSSLLLFQALHSML